MRLIRRCVALLAVALVAVAGATLVKSATTDPPGHADMATNSAAANGRISPDHLTAIGDGHTLRDDAAAAFEALRTAAAEAGITWTINSAYRDYEEQLAMVEKYGLLADGGRAAPPGESDHGLGLSVDLTLDWDEVEWMREHAGTYGFAETIAAEPWHWTYQP